MGDAVDSPGLRDALHEAFQEHAMEVNGERSVVLGWAAVVEWVAPDGHRWLSFAATDARGEPAPTWQAQGYLHNALHDWPNAEDDD